jgi:primosomal protein N' (replication factor Y)
VSLAKPTIAKVVVDLALNREFDYLIPPELSEAVRVGTPVVVPFGRTVRRGFVVGLADRSDYPRLKPIREVVGRKALIEERITDLARWIADYYIAPLEVAVRTVLPAVVRRRPTGFARRQVVELTEAGADLATLEQLRLRAPKQAAALAALRGAGSLPARALAQRVGVSTATLRALERKGLIRMSEEEIRRAPDARHEILPVAPPALTGEQTEALRLIHSSMDTLSPPVVLLFGVTGSGKTEVYLQAIAHAREQDRGAIVLVPEISLTPQTVDRFRARFGEEIAILHSHLSEGERHDEWHRIHEGRASIVVGARSALFAPVRRLGLIVVDEEHEGTYKQTETPCYHARDTAVMRGAREGCAVVLGSATPSLESYHNARLGKYGLARLTRRVDHREMPQLRIVDLRAETEREGRPNVFSRELIQAVHERLARAEQTILFLNRRGYASSLLCPKCGHVESCPGCSVPTTYHKREHRQICHLCGHTAPPPDRCPKCGDAHFRYAGLGTERIEEILRKFFPKARLARMDSDTMTRKEAYREVLGDFRAGRLDILVGTQMIAKGLDFPNVTLVGVIFADLALHLPDFRAGERTFQMLTQVAGRAGRGDITGEVIIQTYTPFHPAIQAVRRFDLEGFYEQELAFRRELDYPPFTHLACLTARGANEAAVADYVGRLVVAMRAQAGAAAKVSDAAPAPFARIQGQYRYQGLIRARSAKTVHHAIRQALDTVKRPADVSLRVDMDAQSLL